MTGQKIKLVITGRQQLESFESSLRKIVVMYEQETHPDDLDKLIAVLLADLHITIRKKCIDNQAKTTVNLSMAQGLAFYAAYKQISSDTFTVYEGIKVRELATLVDRTF
jgi:hypothetical protein